MLKKFVGNRISALYKKALEFVLRIQPFCENVSHPRTWRSAVAPVDKLFQLLSFAFGNNLDGAIGTVRHPSRQAEVPGLLHRRSSEVDSLNPAIDRQVNPRRVLHN
jgi:hypothetical protein